MRAQFFKKGSRAYIFLALLFLGCGLVFPQSTPAKIVFTSKQPGDTAYHIYVMEDDGSHLRRVTRPEFYDVAPGWFPEGTRLVFERDFSRGNGTFENAAFYIIEARGGKAHRFMANHRTDSNPRVSPDGKQLAFNSNRSGHYDIYVMHLASSRIRQVTDNFKHGGWWSLGFGWSPDSQQIAYEHEGPEGENIWIVRADGIGGRKRVSPLHEGATILWRRGTRWSPSGRYLMYTELEGTPDWKKIAERLIIQNVRTGRREIHDFPADSAVLVGDWMGDDHTVLLSIKFEVQAPGAHYDIYRYQLGNRQLTNLTNLPAGHAYDAEWIEGALAVSPSQKLALQWAQLKQSD